MPPPGLSIGVGSDDEDNEIDVSDAGAPPSLALNTTMAGMVLPAGLALGPDSDDDSAESTSEIKQKLPAPDANAYELSKTGAFKLADFQLRPEGGLTVVGGSSSPGQPAHPEDMSPSTGAGVPRINVSSLKELDMMDELGSGASGTVVKARHRSSGTLVAVKCVKILEKAKRDQIVGELRIMMTHAAADCAWLVAMHNAFYEDAVVYTVLEYMDAGSLEDLVKQHAPAGGLHDELELVRVAKPLLSGLNYLHRQLHQIHRDLKPANVMCNGQGGVKIADFGISKSLEGTTDLAQTQVGTTCYMSPERLMAEAYSYPADIWAFGLILLELATGAFPYPQENYFALLGHIQERDAPRLPERCGLSAALADPKEGFVAVCLDKEPARRPSARDLLKHPWLKQAEAKGRSAREARDARLDRSVGSSGPSSSPSARSLDRSRSNLTDSLRELEMSGMLSGLSLGMEEQTRE